MSEYTETERAAGRLQIAPLGAMCNGQAPFQQGAEYTCAANDGGPAEAVHTWRGVDLCAYHSPFDVTEQDRADLAARTLDPMDDEHEDGSESTMGDEMERMFGMPEPESDGPVCGVGLCTKIATHVGLDTDGETKIPVCELDSYNTRFWGVWPIEEEGQFNDAVGVDSPGEPPIGTNKAKPDWTGTVESSIVKAERRVRWGQRPESFGRAVVNEVARRIKQARTRQAALAYVEAERQLSEGLVTIEDAVRMCDKADAHAAGVSLAK